MITKEELDEAIADALAVAFPPPMDHPEELEARMATIILATALASDAVDKLLRTHPGAPQTVTVTFKAQVDPSEVQQLIADATEAMQRAAAVSDELVDRCAEAGWIAHCGIHKDALPWTIAPPATRQMLRTITRAVLEARNGQ